MRRRTSLVWGLGLGLSDVVGVLSRGARADATADSSAEVLAYIRPDARFVVYYGSEDHPALDGYDLVVLDADLDPAVPRRLSRQACVLGYLSLCEVHLGRSWASDVNRQGLLLEARPPWQDARYIDLRDPRWQARVLDDLVPQLLERGFNGLFLDTLDDAGHLERLDPRRHAGMREAAIGLVRQIRRRHPGLPLMMNRGYDLLPQLVADVDMVLAESLRGTWDAGRGVYAPVTPTDVRWQLDRLLEARRLRPALTLCTLDYWSPDDHEGIARLYAQAGADALIAYVATIDLTRIVPRA
jgi:hypothetical protein